MTALSAVTLQFGGKGRSHPSGLRFTTSIVYCPCLAALADNFDVQYDAALSIARDCSGSKHHHVGSSSGRSDLLISSVRRRNCPGNRPTAQPSPNGRRGSRQSPGGNRSPKHSWFYQTATGTASPLSINPSQTERRWPK